MTSLLQKTKSRGYWLTIIRPARFNRHRIPDIEALFPILEETSVEFRGWDFPHLDSHDLHYDIDWIGQELNWQHYVSSWRFYQSGQFIQITGFRVDWRDQSNIWPSGPDWRPMTLFGIGDAIYTFTEIFEFAARLSLSDAGDEEMHIDITIGNLQGRLLYVDSPRRVSISTEYKASLTKFPISIDIKREDLIAKPRYIALEKAIELFKRFKWNTTVEFLRKWQEEINS